MAHLASNLATLPHELIGTITDELSPREILRPLNTDKSGDWAKFLSQRHFCLLDCYRHKYHQEIKLFPTWIRTLLATPETDNKHSIMRSESADSNLRFSRLLAQLRLLERTRGLQIEAAAPDTKTWCDATRFWSLKYSPRPTLMYYLDIADRLRHAAQSLAEELYDKQNGKNPKDIDSLRLAVLLQFKLTLHRPQLLTKAPNSNIPTWLDQITAVIEESGPEVSKAYSVLFRYLHPLFEAENAPIFPGPSQYNSYFSSYCVNLRVISLLHQQENEFVKALILLTPLDVMADWISKGKARLRSLSLESLALLSSEDDIHGQRKGPHDWYREHMVDKQDHESFFPQTAASRRLCEVICSIEDL